MTEEKRGPGRPKGSKNKATLETEATVEKIEQVDFSKINNEWRVANGYMLPVTNLDYSYSEGSEIKSLLGFVEGFGDWDFGISFPFFFGTKITSGYQDNAYWSQFPLLEERINLAFTTLGSDNKPLRLLLIGQKMIGPREWGPQKSVMIYFKNWSEDHIWTMPE